ncbi:fasciclin domain-containing protein [Streptosporangium sp. NPDC020145]|uniref:fasciclin domain-containing protein n=1 Tax=Streptosporangium sp. NPDC020145 TaxID=3154694 RepID=UPI00341C4151
MKSSLLAAALAAVALAALPVAAQASAAGSVLTFTPMPEPSEMVPVEPSGAPSEGPSEGASEGPSEGPSEGAAAVPFGPGCRKLPETGPGSPVEIAKEKVATAVEQSPLLSQLAEALKKSELVEQLNSSEGVTVFAPTNEAFSALPQDVKDKLKADPAQLKKVLTYHVVSGKVKPSELQSGSLETLEGGKLTVKQENGEYTVNDAKVVCGNLPTANAVIYLIDKVLTPPQ